MDSTTKNLATDCLGQGWRALMGMAFIPLYIRYLGIESYSLIGIFAILQAWLGLLDMGMRPALGREMARFNGGAHDAQPRRSGNGFLLPDTSAVLSGENRLARPTRLVDTMTGGRLKRVRPYLNGEDFCFTYGDGVGDVDVSALVAFHSQQARLATLTATQPPGRFGALNLDGERIVSFQEKPQGDGAWINGGYFVLSPKVIDRIVDDTTLWEREPMQSLANEGEFSAYFHEGFWQPMDTLRDKNLLEELWASGKAPWKVWQ